jgi:hypothetical protein
MRRIAAALLLLAGCTADGAESRRRVVALYYAAGVATYCSGLTDRAANGLKRAVQRELASSPLDTAELAAARDAGYIAADYEWSNRGLGGFRRWCLSEGQASVAWLEELVAAPTTPRPNGIRQPKD